MMNKRLVLLTLIEVLQNQRNQTVQSSLDASGNATHEEAKADSKWDTQALESSYIAAGHAMRAKDLNNDIQTLQSMLLDMDPVNADKIVTGSLIECIFENDEESSLLYISSHGGGVEFTVQDKKVTVISPATPLGKNLLGSRVGDSVSLLDGSKLSIEKLMI